MNLIRYIVAPILNISFFLNATTYNTEFRATWVVTWDYINASYSTQQSMEKIDQIMDDHANANMTSVFFQIRQSGTSYYESSYEPWGYYTGYQYPGFDPLEYAVKSAHDRGLELHAWFNVFQTSSMQEGSPSIENPHWVCRDMYGNAMTSNRSLSPGLDEVRQYTIDVAMEVVKNYDIDGLHLDYVRWNEFSNGNHNNLPLGQIEEIRMLDGQIAEDALFELMNARTGRYLYDLENPYSDGIPNGFTTWEDWWRHGVSLFVQTLHDSINVNKPNVRLSAAVLGRYNWGNWQGYNTVYQDGALWFNEGYLEQLTPMHYHWTTPDGFIQMLSSNDQSWEPFIQQGVNEGRLFTSGPGSYILSEQNLWDNHPQIINAIRQVDFNDGFQFFSYGSWKDYQYWDDAGNTFFKNKAIVRNILTNQSNSNLPENPSISIERLNNLEYNLSINTPLSEDSIWTVIFMTPSDSLNSTFEIFNTSYGSGNLTVPIVYDGLQLYEGSYDIQVKNFNRFWIPSEQTADTCTETIPSFLPTLLDVNIQNQDTIDANKEIILSFSKKMNHSSFLSALNIDPSPEEIEIEWSQNWEHKDRVVTVSFPDLLEFGTQYILSIDSGLTDQIDLPFDLNADGIEDWGQVISFFTELTDLVGPQIIDIYPPLNHLFDTDGVFNVKFNETINHNHINDMFIQIFSNGQNKTLEYVSITNDNKTSLSIKSLSPLIGNSHLDIVLHDLSDTLGNYIDSPITVSYNTMNTYYVNKIFIDRFNNYSGWWQPEESGSTTGIVGSETSFSYVNGNFLPGTTMDVNEKKCGKLDYMWDTEEVESFLRLHNGGYPSNISLDTSKIIQLYLYSDGSNNEFTLSIYEYIDGNLSDDLIEVMYWQSLDWLGWRLIEWDLSDSEQVGNWISGNQLLDGNSYFLDGILLRPGNEAVDSGQVYFDDLRIVEKSVGNFPINNAPVIASLPDTSVHQSDNFYFFVEFHDDDESDFHNLTILTDTLAVYGNLYGYNSGSLANINFDDSFIGETQIKIIVNDFGIGELSDTTEFTLNVTNELSTEHVPIIKNFTINKTYPNPFNPFINISFGVDKTREVSLHIYDISGKRVKTFFDRKNFNNGLFNYKWDGKNDDGKKVSNGIYLIRLFTDKKAIERKITFLK